METGLAALLLTTTLYAHTPVQETLPPLYTSPPLVLRKDSRPYLESLVGTNRLARLHEDILITLKRQYRIAGLPQEIKTLDGKKTGDAAVVLLPANGRCLFAEYALIMRHGRAWAIKYKLIDGREGFFIDEDGKGIRLHTGMDRFLTSQVPQWVKELKPLPRESFK